MCLLIHVIIPCLNLGSDKSRAPASYPLRLDTFSFYYVRSHGQCQGHFFFSRYRACCMSESRHTEREESESRVGAKWENRTTWAIYSHICMYARGTFHCGRRRTPDQKWSFRRTPLCNEMPTIRQCLFLASLSKWTLNQHQTNYTIQFGNLL